ncbi:transposase [Streptomyces sp. CB00072]|uniref:transposase n=1 Tax=Streptomyces sp. CB00072 TaxID=1703928 RepID=UPI00116103B1|nr:transposase [Streptomyces sp. CB00072]
MRSTLAAVGLALAGRAGARLASVFGASVSRSTVLRLVEALPDLEVPAPRVVGVDEYATRKGRHYGTVLVDVESRRPVDMLPGREASRLDAFKPYLDDRWNQGCTNAWRVWEEIVPLGYQCSYQRVRAYFRE